jgi:hypothetical protein
VIALRREETGILVMELSEHLWPDNLELAIPVVHDVARSRQNPLSLLVVVDGDFDTPLWDFLCHTAGNSGRESSLPSGSIDIESRRAEKQSEFGDTNAFL